MSDAVAGGLLGLGGVILGVIGTYGFTFFHDNQKERAARERLAAILCIELLQQSEHIIECCTVVNRAFLSEPKEFVDEDYIKKYFPPSPRVYLASLDKFGVLQNEVSADIIKFYDDLQGAKDRTVREQETIIHAENEAEIPETAVDWIDKEGKPWKVDGEIYMHRWATDWRCAAAAAARILRALRDESGHGLNENYRNLVENSLEILEDMRKGNDVTLLPDDDFIGLKVKN